MSSNLKFKKICREYDLFLKNKNFFFEKFCFSFLHIKSSKSINTNFNKIIIYRNKIYRIIPTIFDIIINFFSFSPRHILNNNRKSNILIFSSCINKENLKEVDFYLGHIVKNLNNNFKITLVLRNLTFKGISKNDFNKKIFKDIDVFLIRHKLNIFLELYFVYLYIKSLIKSNLFIKKNNFSNFFSLNSLLNFCCNLRETHQFKNVLNSNDYKIFLTTYEGNAWERLFFYQSKKILPKITNIGYHFNYHLKHEHSIFRNLNKNFDPDIILTSGEYSKKKFFQKKFKCKNIINIGTNKYLKSENQKYSRSKKNILILPEGYIYETLLLYKFVSNFIDQNKNFKFTLRLHPVLKNSCKKLFYDKRIKISSNSLLKDFKINKFALYRGSSSIISAAGNGVIPIYYSFKNELSLDPFFGLNKNIVYSDDFRKFNQILMSNNLNKNQKKIKKFSLDYYSDYNLYKKNLKFLNKFI